MKKWISATELSAMCGFCNKMGSRILRKAESGIPWKGSNLRVRWAKGNGGLQRVVHVSSLPAIVLDGSFKNNRGKKAPKQPCQDGLAALSLAADVENLRAQAAILRKTAADLELMAAKMEGRK